LLKHRLLLGVILAIFFPGLVWLAPYAAGGGGGWPIAPYSTPPGLIVLLVTLLLMPLAIAELRALLARQNVLISLRITIVASMLCTLWPWLEQVGDSIDQQHAALVTTVPSGVPGWYPPPGPDSPEAHRLM